MILQSVLGAVTPPALHQIWVGSETPAWVRTAWSAWDEFMTEKHPGWTVWRWTDETVQGTPLESCVRLAHRHHLPPRGLADLLRICAVSLYGGVYTDSDSVPLRPFPDHPRPWVGSPLSESSNLVLCNAMFSFPAGHPFLADVWERATAQLEKGVTNEHFIAGPRTFSSVWQQRLGEVDILPAFAWTRNAGARRSLRTGEPFDLKTLRTLYPGVQMLHIEYR